MKLSIYHPYIVQFKFESFRSDTDTRKPVARLVEWLVENAKGDYEIIVANQLTHFNRDDIMNRENKDTIPQVNIIMFEKQKDSVLFKMTWGGV